MTPASKELLNVITALPPGPDGMVAAGLSELAARTGRNPITVERCRRRLVDDGLIEYLPGGPGHLSRYRVLDAGPASPAVGDKAELSSRPEVP